MKRNDIYRQVVVQQLEANGVQFGTTIIQYEVRAYKDLRNLTMQRSLLVACTQRLIINSNINFEPKESSSTNFNNYPGLLTNEISLASGEFTATLLNYNPKTLNASVDSTAGEAASTASNSSVQHSSGSSTAQTNSYSESINLGFFGADLMGGLSESSSQSSTVQDSTSKATSQSSDQGNQTSNSSSMTIKDWGSYAIVDGNNQTIKWVWGQEYPWDIMQFKYPKSDGSIDLPLYVQDRLYYGGMVFPPSQLSMFGIDFVSKALWLIQPKEAGEILPSNITFSHTVDYTQASHGLSTTGSFQATLDNITPTPWTYSSTSLDLNSLALDPITSLGPSNEAVIGFIESNFITPPQAGSTFKIISSVNNLEATGTGFTSSNPLAANVTKDNSASITLQFKIIDNTLDYTLFMKCWKTESEPPILTISINENSIEKLITSSEAEGGEDNLVAIILRKKDCSSVDYHDYLQIGMNKITIDIQTSSSSSSPCGIAFRAIAIG